MMKWTTKFSTVLGCALAAVFLFTSTMEVGAVPLTSSPSGTTTTTTTDTNAAEDGNADAAAEDNAAEDNAAEDNAAVTAAAGTVTSATVTSSSVNIRSEASTSASVAGKAASGQELTVTGETQGSDGKTWYAVTFDNVSGYIRSDLVEAHVSEATAEPAVDETQETEEPEEEPIVDNSADYSVAFEDDDAAFVCDRSEIRVPVDDPLPRLRRVAHRCFVSGRDMNRQPAPQVDPVCPFDGLRQRINAAQRSERVLDLLVHAHLPHPQRIELAQHRRLDVVLFLQRAHHGDLRLRDVLLRPVFLRPQPCRHLVPADFVISPIRLADHLAVDFLLGAVAQQLPPDGVHQAVRPRRALAAELVQVKRIADIRVLFVE